VKKLILTATGLIVLAGTSLFLASVSGDDKARREAPAEDSATHKIGVVDVDYILEKYDRVKVELQDLKETGKALEDKLKQMAEKGAELQGEIKGMKEGTPEKKAAEEKLMEQSIKYNAKQKIYKNEWSRDYAKVQIAIYQDIREAVKAIAVHNGITLVVKASREDTVSTTDPQRAQMMMQQPCMFHRKSDDMSDAVISFLNKKYNRENPDAAARIVQTSAEEPAKPAKKAAAPASSGKGKATENRKGND
jgi:Skp family chaperone for outer membrane proteins